MEDIFELYKNDASKQLNLFLNKNVPALFTGILNRFGDHVLPEYFKLVEQFFKYFSSKINKNIPHEYIKSMMEALYRKVTQEIKIANGNNLILHDSSTIDHCLQIFIKICGSSEI